MISDRAHLREDYKRERTSFLLWLLSATIAGFIVQNVVGLWFESSAFERLCALSANAVKQGSVWTLLSYPLLHRNILHLFLVMFSVFFLGRELLNMVGERRLVGLTLSATALGGLAWFSVNYGQGGNVVGATPVACCYLIVFACLFPNREISFLFFFVIPVTTRPKFIAWIALGLDLGGLLFAELSHGIYQTGIPHSAHLGGMLAGWLYFRYLHDADRSWFKSAQSDISRAHWMKPETPAVALPKSARTLLERANPADHAGLRAEVDRILDKINSHGLNALTAEEKRVLNEAKARLGRR